MVIFTSKTASQKALKRSIQSEQDVTMRFTRRLPHLSRRQFICLICLPLIVVIFLSANIPCNDCYLNIMSRHGYDETTGKGVTFSVDDVRAIAFNRGNNLQDPAIVVPTQVIHAYEETTEKVQDDSLLKFNTDLKHITDYRFIERLDRVMENVETLVHNRLQTAIRYSWRNTSISRLILMDIIDDMADIKYDIAHELNLIRIQASPLPNEEDDPEVVAKIQDLKSILMKRFMHIQNPQNCITAKKLVCNINKSCGFGCQMHHVAYCLVVAYVLERVLVVDDREWNYAPQGWTKFFQSWTKTCKNHWAVRPDVLRKSPVPWDESNMKSEYLHCTLIDSLEGKPEWLPPAVPLDIGPKISLFHGHPFVWWMGQIMAFLMRPSLKMKTAVENTMAKIGFWGNVVGVHIRRTDKLLNEGNFYPVKSYFKYVEEYFKKLKANGIHSKPKVYLSTDDAEAVIEAKESYPDIDILYVEDHVTSAGSSDKYSEQALEHLLVDIHLLSHTEFIVCTLSSQVCRVAYELMQSYHVDASKRIISLDQPYYFGGQTPGAYKVVLEHKPLTENELRLRVGDRVFVEEFRAGTLYGMNGRTGQKGSFPAYKVQEVMKVHSFPTYDHVTADDLST